MGVYIRVVVLVRLCLVNLYPTAAPAFNEQRVPSLCLLVDDTAGVKRRSGIHRALHKGLGRRIPALPAPFEAP